MKLIHTAASILKASGLYGFEWKAEISFVENCSAPTCFSKRGGIHVGVETDREIQGCGDCPHEIEIAPNIPVLHSLPSIPSRTSAAHDIPDHPKRAKPMFVDLVPAFAYGFAAAVTPGPLLMFLLSQAVCNGWRRTLPATFSPLITDGPVAVLVLAILSQVPESLIHYLRLIGGAFILYLAFGAWKAWRAFDESRAIPAESSSNSLLKAVVVNWLNPNLYLGWSLILGPIVLGGWHQSPAKGFALIVAFYATLIITMIAMVLVFAAARAFGSRFQKILIACSSAALAGLGFYQLWIGGSALFAAP